MVFSIIKVNLLFLSSLYFLSGSKFLVKILVQLPIFPNKYWPKKKYENFFANLVTKFDFTWKVISEQTHKNGTSSAHHKNLPKTQFSHTFSGLGARDLRRNKAGGLSKLITATWADRRTITIGHPNLQRSAIQRRPSAKNAAIRPATDYVQDNVPLLPATYRKVQLYGTFCE